MSNGGQGEAVPVPPFPFYRRWTERNKESSSTSRLISSNNRLLDSSRELPNFNCGDTLPQIGDGVPRLNGNVIQSNRRRSKWLLTIAVGLVVFLIGGLVGCALDYYGSWDPCILRFPYLKQCKTGTYLGGLLTKVDYKETSVCVVPGIFHNAHFSGWNTDCELPETSQ